GPAGGPSRCAGATRAHSDHLAVAPVVVAALALGPLAHPSLSRWRVWVEDDGVPIARLFERDEPADNGMSIATGGASSGGGRRIEEQLGAGVAANLDDRDVQPTEPTTEEEEAGPRVRIDPRELEGLVREIEDPNGRA